MSASTQAQRGEMGRSPAAVSEHPLLHLARCDIGFAGDERFSIESWQRDGRITVRFAWQRSGGWKGYQVEIDPSKGVEGVINDLVALSDVCKGAINA